MAGKGEMWLEPRCGRDVFEVSEPQPALETTVPIPKEEQVKKIKKALNQ